MSDLIKTSFQFKRGTRLSLELRLVNSNKPKRGEPIYEIDTNRMKIGDGYEDYKNLPYLGGIIHGYYNTDDSEFYEEPEFENKIANMYNTIYVDDATYDLYYYRNNKYNLCIVKVPEASADKAGIMKLYRGLGMNEDGTITQKLFSETVSAFTDALNSKCECRIHPEEGCIEFIQPSLEDNESQES